MSDILRILPLGGVGEIGKNMYVYEYGDEIVVIDCGLMFPEEEMFGIDLVVPDVTYLRERRDKVKAFLITHAHEDHVGGLPYVLPYFPGVPIYASTLARGLLGNKIKEHKLTNNPLMALEPGESVEIGAFKATAFRIGHSIPDAMGIALDTPVGLVVHTGDFKFDHTPVDGKMSDIHALAGFGQRGVLCLVSDSTRAESPVIRRPSASSVRSSATSWRAWTGASLSPRSPAISRASSRSSTQRRPSSARSR